MSDAAASPPDAAPATMEITLNGERRAVPSGLTLVELLASLRLDPRAVAVERNAEIVPRAQVGGVVLAAGDRLEVVRFVQGG